VTPSVTAPRDTDPSDAIAYKAHNTLSCQISATSDNARLNHLSRCSSPDGWYIYPRPLLVTPSKAYRTKSDVERLKLQCIVIIPTFS